MSEDVTLDEFVEDDSEVEGEFVETAAGQLPVDWDTKNVEKLCVLRNGKATNHTEIGEQQFLVYGSNGPIGSYSESNFDGGLIFGRVGAVGEVERVREPVWVSDNAIQASVTDKCNTDFLYYYLSNEELSSLATKTAQPLLNQSTIGNVTVPSPSLSEQRKIATVLYTVDRAIEKTEEIVEKSDRLFRGMMDDIFEIGVSPADKYQETPVGRFPESWEIVQMQDILTEKPSYGILKPGDGDENGVRMIRATDIEHGKLVEEQPIRVSKSKSQEYERTKIYENNILLSVMGTVGRSMCAPKSLEGANVNRALAVLRMDETQVIPKFADFWFRSPHIQSYFETQKFGTAQPRLNLGFLRKMKFPVPSVEEQKEIVGILQDAESRYWTERKTREQFERLKRGLMQDLLSGTVRTTDTNIEVPEEIEQYG